MSYQDELNRLRIAKNVSGLAGTAPMTSRDCLNILAGKTTLASCNLSSDVAANTWAGTVDKTIQWALNVKAGRNPNTQVILSKQDASKLITNP
jgi:hypothetical protein